MTRLARGDHCLRRAAGALGVGPGRVEPEPERDPDRVRPARRSATALSTPPLIATAILCGSGAARNTCASAFASASAASVSPGTAAASSSVSPAERPLEPGRVRGDDPVAVDRQPYERELLASSGVSDHLEHAAQRTGEGLDQ